MTDHACRCVRRGACGGARRTLSRSSHLACMHKSDVGGIVRGIKDERIVRGRRRPSRASPPTPRACALERMAPLADGVELILRLRLGRQFRRAAHAGIGGVFTELLSTCSSALSGGRTRRPTARRTARRATSAGRARPAPLDVAAAARAAAALSRFGARSPRSPPSRVNPLPSSPGRHRSRRAPRLVR